MYIAVIAPPTISVVVTMPTVNVVASGAIPVVATS
jgi:hypothetical protein